MPSTSYQKNDALEDIPGALHTLNLFLSGEMHESEEYCLSRDRNQERLYFATGYSLIQCVKAIMSYEDEDVISGLRHTRHGHKIAAAHRKKTLAMVTRIAGLVLSGLNTSGVGWIKSMTPVERHAELVYAESLYECSILGIIYSGDWLTFIREILNMRTTINTYRLLGQYLETVDAEYRAAHPLDSNDPSVDKHFRSGVYLGVGASHLAISLMPSRVMSIVEIFGYYKGDRRKGLHLLAKAGGWNEASDDGEPGIDAASEGLRRPICDMLLIAFHLYLSGITFAGIDINMAERILQWNLKRYPNGPLFLIYAGRLALNRSRPTKAIEYYRRAIEVQTQYKNLHYVSYWEMAVAALSLWDLSSSLEYWRILAQEATWSKCVYTYSMAACILQMTQADGDTQADIPQFEEAVRLMVSVPGLRQRIAGKSIPFEKFYARKSRSFVKQNKRLALPALELAYHCLAIAHAPHHVISTKMLPTVHESLRRLGIVEDTIKISPADYENGTGGYWDDLCLTRMLEGVCCRYIAYPDPDALPESEGGASSAESMELEDAASRAKRAFLSVFEYGPRVELDHYIIYYSHYEYGRLLACMGDIEGAREHFEKVLSGKPLEVNAAGLQKKYSLQNALMVRTHAAVEALGMQRTRL
ncbi:hypothetical protein FISHEDRAFT_40551 [Fistulina hepatica ATCC 64428]|uniref:TPR-like protein n=1 Tax=Fistulina hepatica ATCC 64428 TaxID=1128425 RepID=A0A0D7AEV1_9AGAR|nr:hypothetical protein FISHEDRAFT_40551 [Fistulina hepatica ATCC 64428]